MSQRTLMSRRLVLRGMIGGVAVAVALPPLEAMLNSGGTAYAGDVPIPKRFGLWTWGNGVKPQFFMPSSTGTSWRGSPPDSLQPFAQTSNGLAGSIEYVSVVSNTWVPFPGNWAHATSWVGLMTASQPLDKNGRPDYSTGLYPDKAQGPWAIDVITNALGGATTFNRINAGISRQVSGADYKQGDTNSATFNPQALFNKLFSGFQPPTSNPPATDPKVAQAVINSKKSILDAIAQDTRDLQKRLGSADKQRLDQHLTNISAIEKGLVVTTPPAQSVNSCTVPTGPGGRPGDLSDGSEPLEAVNRAMSDMIVYALACDRTRVFNLTFAPLQSECHFTQVGVSEGHHGLGHVEPGAQPKCAKTTRFIMSQLAYLTAKMKSVQMGGSTNLLDHSCIWGTSEIEGHNSHGFRNIPHLVIGKAGGALKGGVHIDAGGDPDWFHRFDKPSALSSAVVLTMMRAVGMNQASFGVGQAASSNILTEL